MNYVELQCLQMHLQQIDLLNFQTRLLGESFSRIESECESALTDKTKMSEQLQILQQQLNKFEQEKEQVNQRLKIGVSFEKEI